MYSISKFLFKVFIWLLLKHFLDLVITKIIYWLHLTEFTFSYKLNFRSYNFGNEPVSIYANPSNIPLRKLVSQYLVKIFHNVYLYLTKSFESSSVINTSKSLLECYICGLTSSNLRTLKFDETKCVKTLIFFFSIDKLIMCLVDDLVKPKIQ